MVLVLAPCSAFDETPPLPGRWRKDTRNSLSLFLGVNLLDASGKELEVGRWDEGSGVQTCHAVFMAFSTRNPNVVVPWDVRRVRVVDSERLPNPV